MKKIAFCLFESSGVFKNLLEKKGFHAIAIDKKLGTDIMTFDYTKYKNVQIVIAHPPCTEFAGSGSVWWKKKAIESPWKLEEAIQLVERTLAIIEYHKPRIWFIENPKGRIERCVPKLKTFFRWSFDPCQFAQYSDHPEQEAYTKKTFLWGNFQIPKKKGITPLKPERGHHSMDWCLMTEGKKKLGFHERNELRSKTPQGFARAFVEANYNKTLAYQGTLF